MSGVTQSPSSDPNAAIWYVAKPGGQREGPLPLGILKGRVAAGQLKPDDLLWTQGFASWQPARSMPDLFGPAGGSASGSTAATAMATAQASAGFVKSFVSGITAPSFLRITGRFFGVLSVMTLLMSTMLFLFVGYWFTNVLLFAFMFITCEVLARLVESQQRIEALLQSQQDAQQAGKSGR